MEPAAPPPAALGPRLEVPVPVPAAPSNTLLYVMAAVVVAVFVLIAIVLIQVIRPREDNTALIVSVVGFGTMIITSLFTHLKADQAARQSEGNAGAIQEVHLALNSRLTQLLEMTAKASLAQGGAEERASAAAIPEGVPVLVEVPAPIDAAPTGGPQ